MNKGYCLRSTNKNSNQNYVSGGSNVRLKRKCDEVYQDSSNKRAKNAKESDVCSNRQIVTRAVARSAIVAVVSPENERSRDSYSDEIAATSSSEDVIMNNECEKAHRVPGKRGAKKAQKFVEKTSATSFSQGAFVFSVLEKNNTSDEGSSGSGSDEIAATSSSEDVLMSSTETKESSDCKSFSESTLIKQAESYLEKKKYQKAIDLAKLQTCIGITSEEEIKIKYILSIGYYEQNNFIVSEFLATSIKNSNHLTTKKRFHLFQILSDMFYKQGRYSEVERVVHEGLRIPNLSDDERGLLYSTLSLARFKQKKYEEAKGLEEAMLHLSLSSDVKMRMYYSLFEIYRASNEINKANVSLLSAVRYAEYSSDIKLKKEIVDKIHTYSFKSLKDSLLPLMGSGKNDLSFKIEISLAISTADKLMNNSYFKDTYIS